MKKVCVYCGSNPGKGSAYVQSAKKLGMELVKRNIGLVYGGASVGLMGEIADSVLAMGGNVTGIMPDFLVEKEISHKGLSELIVVSSMHERKAKMAELANGFIALPGGLGTFEELFEALTWQQLGFHKKPCAALNVNGYYNKLLEFLNNAVAEGFIKEVHSKMLIVDASPALLINKMLSRP